VRRVDQLKRGSMPVACEFDRRFRHPRVETRLPRVESTLALLTSLSGHGSFILTRSSPLWGCCVATHTLNFLEIHQYRYSIWRPTSGQQPPLLRRPLHRLRPPCLNLLPLRALRHNSASIRPHCEVCLPSGLRVSSLTNHKLGDRLPTDIARHNRRLDNAELECSAHTFPARIRSDFDQCETTEYTRTVAATGPMRPVQREGPLP
jgi:hypothetical protein